MQSTGLTLKMGKSSYDIIPEQDDPDNRDLIITSNTATLNLFYMSLIMKENVSATTISLYT